MIVVCLCYCGNTVCVGTRYVPLDVKYLGSVDLYACVSESQRERVCVREFV